MSTEKVNVHDIVLSDLKTLMETAGDDYMLPWRQPAFSFSQSNPFSKSRYSGGNVIVLGTRQAKYGYPYGQWATAKQWSKKGCKILDRTQGARIIYMLVKEIIDEDTDEAISVKAIPRYYQVFNVSNTDKGFEVLKLTPPQEVDSKSKPERTVLEPDLAVDDALHAFIESVGVPVKYSETEGAYYSSKYDHIVLPKISRFDSYPDYVSTLMHELVHSTGIADRLNRPCFINYHRSKKDRALCELVAEIGSALLCDGFGCREIALRQDHAKYINHWNTLLKSEPTAFYIAAKLASKAVDYLESFEKTTLIAEAA